jgi:hypothetical protein
MTRAAAMRVARLLAAAACLVLASAAALAQEAAPPDPSAAPEPDATVRDPDFGVAARHFGLQRKVEMFQWRVRSDGGYERAWSDAAIDSSGFAPGHDNPPFPLRNRQWLAKEVRVDGLPLDPAVLSTLGRWTPFRPSFNALPGNLAVTFQPQGDGLGTAENPMAPRIGDLRIHWRELRLPPLDERIVAAGGRWRLKNPGAASAPAGTGDGDAASLRPADARPRAGWLAACVIALLAASGLILWLRRRRREGTERARRR